MLVSDDLLLEHLTDVCTYLHTMALTCSGRVNSAQTYEHNKDGLK